MFGCFGGCGGVGFGGVFFVDLFGVFLNAVVCLLNFPIVFSCFLSVSRSLLLNGYTEVLQPINDRISPKKGM